MAAEVSEVVDYWMRVDRDLSLDRPIVRLRTRPGAAEPDIVLVDGRGPIGMGEVDRVVAEVGCFNDRPYDRFQTIWMSGP